MILGRRPASGASAAGAAATINPCIVRQTAHAHPIAHRIKGSLARPPAFTAIAFKPLAKPVAGVNWAILYGMGLIVAALVLAVIYMFVCTREGEHPDTRSSEDRP